MAYIGPERSRRIPKPVKNRMNWASIPVLAFLIFVVGYTLSPRVLKHSYQEEYEEWEDIPELRERKIYSGHFPYISDDITSFIINAKECPGSPRPSLLDRELSSAPKKTSDTSNIELLQPLPRPLFLPGLSLPQALDQTKRRGRKQRQGSEESFQRLPPSPYDALFIVTSDVLKGKNRELFREIYGNINNTWPFKIKVVFLVGIPKDSEGLETIKEEAHNFSDIVMGNFFDHYDNLTYKTVMGYRWVHTHCRNVNLLLKMDDDFFLDIYKFMDFFSLRIPREVRTIYCYLYARPGVIRFGRYRVNYDEYKDNRYPPFCSGPFIVPTLDLVDQFYLMAKDTRFFRMEDVYSYGMVRSAMVDVQLIHLDSVTINAKSFLRCFCIHKYYCKYMGAQVNANKMPFFLKALSKHRQAYLYPTDKE